MTTGPSQDTWRLLPFAAAGLRLLSPFSSLFTKVIMACNSVFKWSFFDMSFFIVTLWCSLILDFAFYRLLGRLCSILWVGYWRSKDYSDTTVFGWLTSRMSNRTFCSPLRLEAVRCYLMRRSDVEMELSVPMMFGIQKNIVQKIVNESLRSWRTTRPV